MKESTAIVNSCAHQSHVESYAQLFKNEKDKAAKTIVFVDIGASKTTITVGKYTKS